MKVALINSRTSHSPQPPLGILYIAAVLEKEGYNVKVWDPFKENNYLDKVTNFQPDLIGISLLSSECNNAAKTINKLKHNLPEALIVLGGPHPSLYPEDTLRSIGADFVIMGDGEFVMVTLCKYLENNTPINTIPGIVFFDQNKNVIKNPPDIISDLDVLPLPARHLLPFEEYLIPPGHIRGIYLQRSTTVSTRRGCPYSCVYCGVHAVHSKRMRVRSVHLVIKEIEFLISRYDIDGLWFVDDTFTTNKKWLSGFCKEMIEHEIRIKWACHARVNDMSENLLKEMKNAGCVQLDIGVESGSDKVLKVLKKGATVAMAKDAFANAKKVGIRTMASFILGNPTETYEDIEQTERLAKEIRPNFTVFTYLTPLPGTELYQLAVKNNWLNPEFDTQGYSWETSEYPVMKSNFSKEELKQIRSRLENKFALRNFSGIILENKFFFIKLFITVLKYPGHLITGIKRFIRSGKISDLTDTIIKIYRLSLIK